MWEITWNVMSPTILLICCNTGKQLQCCCKLYQGWLFGISLIRFLQDAYLIGENNAVFELRNSLMNLCFCHSRRKKVDHKVWGPNTLNLRLKCWSLPLTRYFMGYDCYPLCHLIRSWTIAFRSVISYQKSDQYTSCYIYTPTSSSTMKSYSYNES
jgi:hypothetical protein